MTVLVTSAVVKNNEDKLLLVQEGKKDVEGLWNLPGGKLEGSETPEEGVKREVMEETGYLIEPTELVGVYLEESKISEENVVIFLYRSKITGKGEENPDTEHEILDKKFFEISQINNLELRSQNKIKMIKDAEDGKRLSNDRLVDSR